MKKIGFIGAYDKTDVILSIAKVLTMAGKQVLVMDNTITQKCKYVVPVIDEITNISHDVIDYSDYQENDEPLIDFINLGKATLENPDNIDELVIKYIDKYGLLGFIH